MPGWPTVDRAADQELVQALRRGDADAAAKLYDSYGERLHDYAGSLSGALAGDGGLAEDAVHDALVTAQESVHRLKEPARLRAWLYALTRAQVRARLLRRPDVPAGRLPLPDPGGHEDPELADLVHETLGELGRVEREVLELSVRHGLTPSEAGAVLGMTSRQAAARLTRARDQLENAAAAVVLARVGRAHCPDLSAMVDSWEGPLSPLLRRRLSGHIGGCEVCTEGRHRKISAARLLDMVPIAYPTLSLRHRVIDTCVKPELEQTRTLITDLGDGFDRTGFPVAADRRSRRGRPRRVAPLALAGACLLATTGVMVVMNDASNQTTLRPVQTTAPTEDSPTEDSPTDDSPAEDTPTPDPAIEEDEPSPSPSPSRTRSPRATPPPSARRPDTRRAAVPTLPRRSSSARARLGVSCPDVISGAVRIGLRARYAAITWAATTSENLKVLPAGGSIKAGASVTLWLTVVNPSDSGSGRVSFTSNGGTAKCELSWRAEEAPVASDPPPDAPAATEEPASDPEPPDSESRSSATSDLLHEPSSKVSAKSQ